MGIQGLTKLIGDHAPKAISEHPINYYFSRKVAIDASMSIYQFLIAVRSEGNVLMNEQGETTSHLMGLFYRTLRMVDNGIQPVYVFDGKPPTLKSGELAKRYEKRAQAQTNLEVAKEEGNAENLDKFSRRTVKVTKEHNEECKKLLKLMGIPYIEAPCEAEAQCAQLARMGLVYAAGSEDMDTLTFSSPILLRHLTFSEARKEPILEIHLDKVLEGMSLTMDQFIDLCILLGCDYCPSIKGIGPMRAYQLIKEHHSIEKILDSLDKQKYKIPEDWQYKEARRLFKEPDVLKDDVQLKWEQPDTEGLIDFLVKQKNFNEERIRNAIGKLQKHKNAVPQGRLDSFFKVVPKEGFAKVGNKPQPAKGQKRKANDKKGGSAKKK